MLSQDPRDPWKGNPSPRPWELDERPQSAVKWGQNIPKKCGRMGQWGLAPMKFYDAI